MDRSCKISVVVPAYNEEATIIVLLERVRAQRVDGFEFEVIVIDDGSRDRTPDLLHDNAGLYDRLVTQSPNQGKGAAVIAGLSEASGDYVLFQDADLEYDPDEYESLLLPVLRFDADVVIGSRFAAPKYTRVANFWNRVGNGFITLLFNILNNTTFTDIFSCYLLYRRKLVSPDSLTSMGWEQHAEILSRAVAAGRSFYEVPISYNGRTYDEGKKIRAYHVFSVIWTILYRRFVR